MKKYLGTFSVDIYDLGGIAETRVGDEAEWIVRQYILTLGGVADVDLGSIEQKVSGEFIDEELDRYRNLRFAFVFASTMEKQALYRELFRRLREIDTGCMAQVELEHFYGA